MELSTACVRESHEEVFEVAGIRRRISLVAFVVLALRSTCTLRSSSRFARQYHGRRDAQRFPADRRRGNRRRPSARADHGMHALPRRQSRGAPSDRHSGHRELCAAEYLARRFRTMSDAQLVGLLRRGVKRRRDERVAHASEMFRHLHDAGSRANPRLGAHRAGQAKTSPGRRSSVSWAASSSLGSIKIRSRGRSMDATGLLRFRRDAARISS